MHVVLNPLFEVINIVIYLYIRVLLVAVVMSWLVNFNIINTRQRVVYMVMDALNRITEPALRPIRRVMPDMGGLDISPIVLMLILYFIQRVLGELALSLALAN
jgi:YggT family protein